MTDDYVYVSLDDITDNDISDSEITDDSLMIAEVDDIFSLDKDKRFLNNLKKNCNIMCIFQFKKYIQDIWESYKKNEDNMLRQFYIDFDRQDIFVDDKQIFDANEFINYISILKSNKCLGFSCYNLVLMLCNQSSFFIPYHLMCKLYSTQNTLVVSRTVDENDRTTISLKINEFSLAFSLKTNLYTVDMDTSIAQKCISVELNFDLSRKNKEKVPIGFIKWKIVDIQN